MSVVGSSSSYGPITGAGHGTLGVGGDTTNLADVLERVLDKGVVIAGDIQINLLDIELLTIKLRLIVASVDTARRMGIRWWESDPMLAGDKAKGGDKAKDGHGSLSERVGRLEHALEQKSRAGHNEK